MISKFCKVVLCVSPFAVQKVQTFNSEGARLLGSLSFEASACSWYAFPPVGASRGWRKS